MPFSSSYPCNVKCNKNVKSKTKALLISRFKKKKKWREKKTKLVVLVPLMITTREQHIHIRAGTPPSTIHLVLISVQIKATPKALLTLL